jgi:hypothetical protein
MIAASREEEECGMHVPIIIDQVVAVFVVMIIDNGRIVGCLTLPIHHHSATHTCCIILSVGQQAGKAYLTTKSIQAVRCDILSQCQVV